MKINNILLFSLFLVCAESMAQGDCTPALYTEYDNLTGAAFDRKVEESLREWSTRHEDAGNTATVLAEFIAMWTTEKRLSYPADDIGILANKLRPEAELGDRVNISGFPREPTRSSYIYPYWAYIKAKSLTWLLIEWSPILTNRALRESTISDVHRLLTCAASAFPHNFAIQQYLGIKRPWNIDVPPNDTHAPKWAVLQYEALQRIRRIADWWIANRQGENGMFGGGAQDDVEMWRWWAPILIARAEPKYIRAQERLINAVLLRADMKLGYVSSPQDVEHSAENTLDTLIPAMLMDLPIGQSELEKYSGLVKHSFLRTCGTENSPWFKSLQLGSFDTETVVDPVAMIQVPYHSLLFIPMATAKWIGKEWRSEDFEAWLHIWIKRAEDTALGKPKHVFPTYLNCAEDNHSWKSFGNWYQPFDPKSELSLYNWGAGEGLLAFYFSLIYAYQISGNPEFLRALVLALNEIPPTENSDKYPPNFRQIQRYLYSMVSGRLQSLDATAQSLLKGRAESIPAIDLEDEKVRSIGLSKRLTAALIPYQFDFEMFTYEVRWTDRVIDFDANYRRFLDGRPYPETTLSNVLYEMITGDAGPVHLFPQPKANWSGSIDNLAVAIYRNQDRELAAELYSFGGDYSRPTVKIYSLPNGEYCSSIHSIDAGASYRSASSFTSSNNGATLQLGIPSERRLLWRVSRGACVSLPTK